MSDLISRNRILNLIEMWMKIPSYNESELNIMKALYYEVRTASVEEPKKGRWEERSVFEDEIQQWQSARCSVCEKYHTTPYLYYFDNFNYCPNCGAKMEVTE